MGVRNLHQESTADWLGLDSNEDPADLTPNKWNESLNVIVGSSGSATAMRSPLRWNPDLAYLTIAAFAWPPPNSKVLADVQNAGTGLNDTYLCTTSSNTLVEAGQTFAGTGRTKRLNINSHAFTLTGTEAKQVLSGTTTTRKIGIDPPAAAPAVSIVAGGTLTLAVGVTVSYAYRNSVTLHVGKCSAVSANSGTTAGGNTLRVATVASAVGGIDGIVFFISQDGGANRYLVIDANGAPIVYANATANVDITAAFILDTNTTETAYSARPSDLAGFMFEHQNRIFMLYYSGATTYYQITYSGLEAIGIGVPQEAYPPYNVIVIPGKSERAIGGISTPVGALIFSERNAYLLTGQVTDNVVSSQNVLSASYRLEALQWGLGTRSPYTIQSTPFGVIWLDHTNHVMLWPFQGMPVEIGLPLRKELSTVSYLAFNQSLADATWYQSGEQSYYVLGVSKPPSGYNNQTYIISMYTDPESRQVVVTTAMTDIYSQAIVSLYVGTSTGICLVATNTSPSGTLNGAMRQILDLDTAGSGWGSQCGGDGGIYFAVTTGNFKGNTNFNHLHSIRFDAAAADTQVLTRNFDDSAIEGVTLEVDGNTGPSTRKSQTCFALLDRYGTHHILRFTFPKDDVRRRDIKNLRISYSAKGRVL